MPQEKNNRSHYENLQITKPNDRGSSESDGDFVPMGSGRKSQYAMNRRMPDKQVNAKKQTDRNKTGPKSVPKKKTAPSGRNGATSQGKKAVPAARKPGNTPDKSHYRVSGTGSVQRKPSSKNPKNKVTSYSVNHSGNHSGDLQKTDYRKNSSSKKSGSKKKRYSKGDFLSYGYLGVMALAGFGKQVFSKRRNRIIAGVVVGLVILICCYRAVVAMYNSNTIFADGKDAGYEDTSKTKEITDAQNRDKVTYFLIVGVDKNEMLTDCIWVLCFDNKAHKMNVLQIPRDTYVGEYSMSPHKANAIFESTMDVSWCEKCDRAVTDDDISSGKHTVCGEEISTKTVTGMSSLFYFVNNELHIPIDYYVKFTFDGFEKAIDALGGVDIFLPHEMEVYYTKTQHERIPAGQNHLDGDKTLKFMRNRKTYIDGDLGRIKAQRKIIHAILEKVQDLSLTQTFNVVLAANGSFTTDMSPANIKSFIAPVKNCKADDLHMFELPGEAKTVKGSSYYICDDEKTVELINEYMLPYGDKLQAGDIDLPDP